MNTNLTNYKRKKKIQTLLEKGGELARMFQRMKKELQEYKHFIAAKEVLNNMDQNEAFLCLSLKKLKDELNEIQG